MTDKIDLPGGWAKLRDPEDVPERLRRPLLRVQESLGATDVGQRMLEKQQADGGLTEAEVAAMMLPLIGSATWEDFQRTQYDQLLCALVEEWSFETPITVDAMQDLPGRAYKALRAECDPLLPAVLGNVVDAEQEIDDPNSPTTPGSV
jgi:hypothetical protein